MKRTRPMVSLRLAMSLVPLLALLSGPSAPSPQEPAPQKKGQRHPPELIEADMVTRQAVCRWADRPPVLDGKLDDPCWQKGAVIDHFAAYWTKTPRAGTFAYLVWDDDALYYAASMVDAELRSFGTQRNDTLWEGDVFEIFLKPSNAKPEYFEFQANPRTRRFRDGFSPPWRRSAGVQDRPSVGKQGRCPS